VKGKGADEGTEKRKEAIALKGGKTAVGKSRSPRTRALCYLTPLNKEKEKKNELSATVQGAPELFPNGGGRRRNGRQGEQW